MDRPPRRAIGADDACLLYTSDAADERSSVDLGGRRIIKKKKEENIIAVERCNKQSEQQHHEEPRRNYTRRAGT